MSERKVLNKYYPPDFDPSKLPRVKRPKNRQFTIRLMAPCNMRCRTCGEYIYKGKKFNARKEDVVGTTYLGIQIYRFYIKCTRCLAEITFKTDPANGDYELEHGAIRMFESVRLAERKLKEEEEEKKNEEANNPMKILENRTRDSRREIVALEDLENLQQVNAKNAEVDLAALANFQNEYEKQLLKLQIEAEEAEIKRIFHKNEEDTDEMKVKEEIEVDDKKLGTCEYNVSAADEVIKTEPTQLSSQRSLLLSAIARKRNVCEASLSTFNTPLVTNRKLLKEPELPANSNAMLVDYDNSSSSE